MKDSLNSKRTIVSGGVKQEVICHWKAVFIRSKTSFVPQTLWKYEDVGHTQEAKKELLEFVAFEQNENVLNTVKPTRLLQRILQIATDGTENEIRYND